MITNNDAIPLLDFKNGDLVTELAINDHAIEVYAKFNNLNPYNVKPLNTGFFYDENNYLFYANHSGLLSTSTTRKFELDDLIDDVVDEINELLNLI